jgi:hypothetical protein
LDPIFSPGSGERESSLEGALDLREKRGGQTPEPPDGFVASQRALICSVTTLDANVRRAVPWNDHMVGRKARRIFGQRHNDIELAEMMDAVVGHHDRGPGLLDHSAWLSLLFLKGRD